MSTVIVDYGLGNIGSILNMMRKIGQPAVLSSSHDILQKAERLILPGVGAFDSGMKKLKAKGLVELISEEVLQAKKPILGICLGMQLLLESSEEGSEPGLGLIPGSANRFDIREIGQDKKIPHMGWNYVDPTPDSALFANLGDAAKFYFVHSYFAKVDRSYALASANYGVPFTSSIGRENIMGVQFHPEKSHKYGMQLLKNFVESY